MAIRLAWISYRTSSEVAWDQTGFSDALQRCTIIAHGLDAYVLQLFVHENPGRCSILWERCLYAIEFRAFTKACTVSTTVQ